jgi:hypothetical protein
VTTPVPITSSALILALRKLPHPPSQEPCFKIYGTESLRDPQKAGNASYFLDPKTIQTRQSSPLVVIRSPGCANYEVITAALHAKSVDNYSIAD